MKQYAVVELAIHDPSWVPEYTTHVTRLVAQHGGRYLARTGRLEKLEGSRELPNAIAIIEFPSMQAARAFYGDPAYQPYLEKRRAGASSEITLVAAEDVAAGAG